ncbi:MAG: hypothetical protein NVS4B5_18860 [Vulcanimicrobiaceae bacterium]
MVSWDRADGNRPFALTRLSAVLQVRVTPWLIGWIACGQAALLVVRAPVYLQTPGVYASMERM